MDYIDIYNNIASKVYNVSKNKLECILTLKDGKKLRAEEPIVYRTNVFGYDVIDPVIEAKCLEAAINSYQSNQIV